MQILLLVNASSVSGQQHKMIWKEGDKIYISGHGTAAVAERTIWPGNSIIPIPRLLINYTVSSTDVNDTDIGTGAQQVEVTYLNKTLERKSLILTLNGQTGVEIEALYIEQLTVMAVGSGGTNAGIVYIGTGAVVAGVPAVVYDLIEIGHSVSQTVRFTVPIGQKFTVESIKVYKEVAVTDVTIQLCKTLAGITYVVMHLLEGDDINYVLRGGEIFSLKHLNATVGGEVYLYVTGKLESV